MRLYIFYLNGPAMFFDYFLDDRQPQSCTSGLGGNVRFENPGFDLFAESLAIIAYAKPDSAWHGFGAHHDSRFCDADHSVLRVLQEIVNGEPPPQPCLRPHTMQAPPLPIR